MYAKFSSWGKHSVFGLFVFIILLNTGCESMQDRSQFVQTANLEADSDYYYIIAPGDLLQIFIWRNSDISTGRESIPVRPDGRISSSLVEDMGASGKTPTQLARDLEQVLAQ